MSRRILLADDSLTIQKVVELTFADTDYEVIAVSSGDDLLRRLPESSADVIICDVIMPGRDGYDVCQEIKSNPDFLHLPVILLTGTFEPFDRDRALAAGCSEIVTKPFEAKKLVDAVERLTSGPGPGPRAFERFDDEPFEEGRVTPPPPIMAPEDLVEVESFADLDETTPTPRTPPTPSEPAPHDEALDFSTSGFLEMEAAGLEKRNARLESPNEGLEFEPGFEPPVDEAEPSDPFVDRTSRTAGFAAEAVPETPGAPTPITESDLDVDVLEDPFASSSTVDDEPFPSEIDREPEAVSESPAVDTDTGMTTPINVAAVMGGEELQPAEETPVEDANEVVDDLANADTQDFAVHTKEGEPEAEPTPEPTGLSDDDIDRIARRVVELSGNLIEHIAWEVIPDMAEIVVRERVREIEAASESEHS